jgi:hypothetical protein
LGSISGQFEGGKREVLFLIVQPDQFYALAALHVLRLAIHNPGDEPRALVQVYCCDNIRDFVGERRMEGSAINDIRIYRSGSLEFLPGVILAEAVGADESCGPAELAAVGTFLHHELVFFIAILEKRFCIIADLGQHWQ